KEEALQILREELAKFRKLSYAELSSKIGNQGCWGVQGDSGVAYQIEVDIFWGASPKEGGNLRVQALLDAGGLTSIKPLVMDFIITPAGKFL
ncbi:MAG: hypothetical protein K1X79_04975, partial [Oligoflexia bacterium]|nr:hypothetical protein [Oligoflexia bacterium]